jgi:hypothetical protein
MLPRRVGGNGARRRSAPKGIQNWVLTRARWYGGSATGVDAEQHSGFGTGGSVDQKRREPPGMLPDHGAAR